MDQEHQLCLPLVFFETSDEAVDEKHFIKCQMSCHVQWGLKILFICAMFICYLNEGELQKITVLKWLFFYMQIRAWKNWFLRSKFKENCLL